MREIKNIIFLDVDGPINTNRNKVAQARMGKPTSSFKIDLPKETIMNLKTILDTIPNTKIVLSSKWRLRFGDYRDIDGRSPARVNLERQLNQYGIYIFSETPCCINRGVEISTWLNIFRQREGYTPPYIILDDNIDTIIDTHRGHVVYCDPEKGLSRKALNISINLLRKFNYELQQNLKQGG